MQMTFKLFFSFVFCLALFLVSGCGSNNGGGVDSLVMDSAFAQPAGATAGRWEYKATFLSLTGRGDEYVASLEKALNQFGSEGWELVSIPDSPNGIHYFKRPKR